jgi:chitodextrinase
MNTAAFFCLGGMEILEHVDEIPRPSGLEAEPLDENSVKVKWSKVHEAAYYRVYVDSVLVDSTTATSYIFNDLQTYTSYRFFVQAVSAYRESSDWGYVSARTKDLTPPTPPTNVQVTEVTMYKIVLSWDAGTDNIAVDKYVVYVNGKRYSRPKYTSVSITGLDPATTYQIELETLDTSGNASERVALQASTHSNTTDILQPATNTPKTIYTLSGQPVATTPAGQVHIVQSGNTTSKQIKQ